MKYPFVGQYAVTDSFTVSLMQRGRNSMKVIAVAAGLPEKVLVHPYDPSTSFTNLTLSYTPHTSFGKTELYLNVQNLFNKEPDVYYAGANSSPGVGLTGFFPPNGDDIVGRYYTAGLRFRL